MRRFARQTGKIVLIFILAYLFPKIVLFYVVCGIYDVSRNSGRTPELFEKYFLGNGLLTWLLSPVNTLLDLLSLPYVNKGVYQLEDLPPGHQAEIIKLIESTKRQDLVGQLQQAAAVEKRSMFFFKWYGTNVDTIVRVPEFHGDCKYVMTIGVSVFNKRQSTSKHFGPLRATLRVLYNIDDVVDDSAYIVVGNTTSYWRGNKLFIFDDTLFHQSFNETDRPRHCLFVDIVRPTMMPAVFKSFIHAVGILMSQGSNKVFYGHWKVFKNPTAT
ncbi:MAG: aspartyl/asparaginyl beta-hydroxylase domain-containing protein [Hyphomicrobiales bacterium]|nr:aspartyl/asparaginyl beta-hydroxylase domain-containing protein [Hyphomicrobiales bacterium]